MSKKNVRKAEIRSLKKSLELANAELENLSSELNEFREIRDNIVGQNKRLESVLLYPEKEDLIEMFRRYIVNTFKGLVP